MRWLGYPVVSQKKRLRWFHQLTMKDAVFKEQKSIKDARNLAVLIWIMLRNYFLGEKNPSLLFLILKVEKSYKWIWFGPLNKCFTFHVHQHILSSPNSILKQSWIWFGHVTPNCLSDKRERTVLELYTWGILWLCEQRSLLLQWGGQISSFCCDVVLVVFAFSLFFFSFCVVFLHGIRLSPVVVEELFVLDVFIFLNLIYHFRSRKKNIEWWAVCCLLLYRCCCALLYYCRSLTAWGLQHWKYTYSTLICVDVLVFF